ncbi:hypothetical protein D9758_018645 [Tetrapyrgos nigripes]|uniref:Uncharacterized protein n=1 Tax=Tetrapyrgos nigripes TaxID=182062 RepID=A0A8H5FAM7_9AGAR|nr:hypothetical protein D9758_018645 [Tetrapyrgos nigripes]
MKEDLEWWLEQLQLLFLGLHIIKPPAIDTSISLYVDTSTLWGIGLILNNKWLAWQFKEGWQGDGQHIGWAEMFAIKLAILTLISSRIHHTHIRIYSDNQGVVRALHACYSRGKEPECFSLSYCLLHAATFYLAVGRVDS